MADAIYLSCWLRGFTEHNMLASFEKALRRFPYSKLAPSGNLRIYAIAYSEPVVFERRIEGEINPFELIKLAREFQHPDCAYELETYWDLWQFGDEWSLAPSRVAITCYAPMFPSELGEQIRIDCGHDSLFLPPPEMAAGAITALGSNIRSLLHLASDIGKSLVVEKKTLWSESGENLAERLEAELKLA